MRTKVLVTGASGFVGRRLCAILEEKGHSVIGVGRVRPANWSGEFIELDLTSTTSDLSSHLGQVKAIVHLASRVHVGNETGLELLPLYRRINTDVTRKLANQAIAAGVERFVYMSSVKAVGEKSLDGPLTGATDSAPVDPYGVSKLESENLLQELASSSFQVAILRPPLVYGPGVKANFRALMSWVQRGIPLPLAGVKNRRSLIYVDNLVSAIQACLSAPKVSSAPYFVADIEVFSTAELVRTMALALGKKPALWFFPVALLTLLGRVSGQSGKIARLTENLELDTNEFRRDFSWTPPFTASQGIKETAHWIQSQF